MENRRQWTAQVITLLPEAFPGLLAHGIIGRALKENIWALETIDLRDFGIGKHRAVDDTPAGGGAGMVLRPDIVSAALTDARAKASADDWPLIFLSPRGKPFTQALAKRYAQGKGITLFSARFEGVDERVIDKFQPEEVSLGDFVLSGGEIAAQALIDASLRLIPQVLGNQASLNEESFSEGLLEYPQYTRPTVWEGREIPEVLLSGHHGEISSWRRERAERLTKERRPDLWRAYSSADSLTQDRDSSGDHEL